MAAFTPWTIPPANAPPRRVDGLLIRFTPVRGLDPSARGLVSGKRSPLKGGAPGEVAWGDDLEGEGAGPPIVWASSG